MQIDIVIPTYNRSALLARALRSLFDARMPAGCTAAIHVADNNSRDDTAALVASLTAQAPLPLHYHFVAQQGVTYARNAAIAAGNGDVIGFIDDDERVDAGWIEEIARAFDEPGLDFIGGPYLPEWEAPPPDWLPVSGFRAVIGWVELSDRIETFGPGFAGEIMSGNFAVRRRVLDEVGAFSHRYNRIGSATTSGEDRELFLRLMKAGKHGQYRPGLIIHHWIPVQRLRRDYYRRWTWHNGRSVTQQRLSGLDDGVRLGGPGAILGLPRFMYGEAARSAGRWLRGVVGLESPPKAFAAELNLIGFAGALSASIAHRRG